MMFKLSKQLNRSPQHDRIICKREENEKTFLGKKHNKQIDTQTLQKLKTSMPAMPVVQV